MSSGNKIAVNAFFNTVRTVLGIVFPLITYPYVSRVLGVENMGIYNFSTSFISYFLLLAALGISTYGIREGTKYRNNCMELKSFVSELFTINMVSTLVSYIGLLSVLFIIPAFSVYSKYILLLSLEIIFATIGVSWVFNIFEDFVPISIATTFFQLLSLVLTFVFVRSSVDLYNYVFVILIANSGANLFGFFYIRYKHCKFSFAKNVDWKRHLKPILIVFSTSVAITVYVSSDNIMLGIISGDYSVGLYGTAVKIYTILKSVLSAVVVVLIPRFTQLFQNKDLNGVNSLFSKSVNLLTVIMIPTCVGVFSISKDIVLIVSGEEYIESAIPLRILCLAIVFSLYAFVFVHCILIPNCEEKHVFFATAITAFINIILNLFLLPKYGIRAAAYTTVIAELIILLLSYIYSKNKVKITCDIKNLISVLVGCCLIGLVCYLSKLIPFLVIRLVVSIVGSVFVYSIVLLIFKNPVFSLLKDLLHAHRS